MNRSRLTLLLAIFLVLCACEFPSLTTALNPPTPTSTPRVVPPSREPPPPAVKPSPTALPLLAVTQPAPSAKYTFHINFILDESVVCASNSKCDAPYTPRMVLYFRGNLSVQPDRLVSGDGTMTFLDIAACKTLMPDVSSCKVSSASNGSFTISGKSLAQSGAKTEKLQLTLRLKELPKLSATMTTMHPVQGQLTIPFDSTYAEALKRVFENAQVFDTAFDISPVIVSGSTASDASVTRTFEGTSKMPTSDNSFVRTMHGLGGLFFIPTDTPMPKPNAP